MTDTVPAILDLTELKNSTVQYLYARRSEIDMDPAYQRQGAIWSIEKQQLLIDSLINEFDVPKIYFHQFNVPRQTDSGIVRWALVDGKQRLEAIFGFLENKFALSDDFVYLPDASKTAAGRTYSELTSTHPSIISTLNATRLNVIVIRTDDLELVEEMFSRLNEAVPLNAAEKRNALGGPLPQAVRDLCDHNFFKLKLPFSNRRYRHYDLASKFLYWTDHRVHQGNRSPIATDAPVFVREVKKVRLDTFFKDLKNDRSNGVKRATADLNHCRDQLDRLGKIFVDKDPLLTSIGMVSVYYLLSELRDQRSQSLPERSDLTEFENARKIQRIRNDDELQPGQYEMLEFSRLAQSPNDGGALYYRLKVMDTWLTAYASRQDPMLAVNELFATLED